MKVFAVIVKDDRELVFAKNQNITHLRQQEIKTSVHL